MVVLGWVILGVLAACFVFLPPALLGMNYLRELGVWLLILASACIVTAMIVFGVFAVTGNLG